MELPGGFKLKLTQMKTKTTIQLSVVILALMLTFGFRIDSVNSNNLNNEHCTRNIPVGYSEISTEDVIWISENVETEVLKHEAPTPFVGIKPIRKN